MRNQSRTTVWAVPSGSRQYSAIEVGERSQTSPTSPSGTGPASSSQMPTSMPPRGRPTVKKASSSSASNAVPVPQPPLSVDE